MEEQPAAATSCLPGLLALPVVRSRRAETLSVQQRAGEILSVCVPGGSVWDGGGFMIPSLCLLSGGHVLSTIFFLNFLDFFLLCCIVFKLFLIYMYIYAFICDTLPVSITFLHRILFFNIYFSTL